MVTPFGVCGGSMLLIILLGCILTIIILLLFAVRWVMATWQHLTMEELIYHLTAPLEGTNQDLIADCIFNVILPTVICIIVVIVAIKFIKKAKRKLIVLGALNLLFGILLACTVYDAWVRLDIAEYLELQSETSDFIEIVYVNPADVKLTFPDEKRNLIYIFLESMETTYADQASGGAFEENYISELTRLSERGENFSGKSEELNGAHVMSGASWTIAGMFAQSAGVPLKREIGQKALNLVSDFYPGVVCLGDILEEEGYNQMLMVGSNAAFGGRDMYYEQHGNVVINDYNAAVEKGLIESGYKLGTWGYEDAKLFEFAKNEILTMAETDTPFCFTMLTVDTHFEDGTVCQLCGEEFGDNQYANVMACSSRQVLEFVDWLQEQSFYDNTTVIISGDHLTMDSDFCNEVSEEYERKTYVNILNADVEVTDAAWEREYSTFDMFPTTLAAMGVQIEGDRLGLGTNLYSKEKTLLEQYGYETLDIELRKDSEFMTQLEGLDEIVVKEVVGKTHISDGKFIVRPEGEDLLIRATELYSSEEILKELYAVVKCGEKEKSFELIDQKDGKYENTIETSWFEEDDFVIEYHWISDDKEDYLFKTLEGKLSVVLEENGIEEGI